MVGFGFRLSDFLVVGAIYVGVPLAFISAYRMQWRLYREDAERPEERRIPKGDWRGLLVFWYFARHGLDPLARTFLIGMSLLIFGIVMVLS